MSGIIIFGGYVFWCAVAFFGSRSTLREPAAPLWKTLDRAGRLPGGLVGPAVAGHLAGVYFLAGQVRAVAQNAGVIGPHFLMAIVCGVLASVCLAAVTVSRDA